MTILGTISTEVFIQKVPESEEFLLTITHSPPSVNIVVFENGQVLHTQCRHYIYTVGDS